MIPRPAGSGRPAGPGERIRGAPLAMLIVLLAGWGIGRAMWWEDPYAALPPAGALAPPGAVRAMDVASVTMAAADPPALLPMALPPSLPGPLPARAPRPAPRRSALMPRPVGLAFVRAPGSSAPPRLDAGLALAHHLLWQAALRQPARQAGAERAFTPFLPPPAARTARDASGGRWSLDAWAFWRQGSDAAPISEGRVPIYGASQAGAVLHYRLAPGSRREPRLYARAYRALVRRGENEGAIGASLRPAARVPLRLAAEVRYTDGAFADTVRPAAYAVTEIPPLPLVAGTRIEAYAQAGWVGGSAPTPFADGQASVTGEVRRIAARSDGALRLSLGAGAWGGAQDGAQRIDIGPTVRLDLRLGAVPARLAIDWRERVGGDAGPESGLAATLSARF